MIMLNSGMAQAEIDPDHGAGIVALTFAGHPILSTGSGRAADSPFAQGMNLLAPFSNRISRPFAFQGQTHPIPANLPGEPFAIHGDSFQRRWSVAAQSATAASLTVQGEIGPFRYDAVVDYSLTPDALSVRLQLTNRTTITLPFGGGFHPWFNRNPSTRLGFRATGHWPEDDRHLPATTAPVQPPPDWRFDPPGSLPKAWINAGFSGWDGVATIHQPGLDLRIDAPGLTTALVYSPGDHAAFFCFEPVTHPVDAHNLPGQPGLIPLPPGQSLTMALRLSWQPNDATPPKEQRA